MFAELPIALDRDEVRVDRGIGQEVALREDGLRVCQLHRDRDRAALRWAGHGVVQLPHRLLLYLLRQCGGARRLGPLHQQEQVSEREALLPPSHAYNCYLQERERKPHHERVAEKLPLC
ncbi:hypothetical protein Taro_035582 [Colocasia esculenta]|uniref:Uncharacterized protein n=1 Tax=Colocasia esculenta TaxID=4460 RepID=A0A843W0U0_COLES|nr:hypothetical protein [Colocasia esculenta]